MNELILEIMKIALEKNKRNKNTIMITYCGHVEDFKISIYKNGWQKDAEPDFSKGMYLDKDELNIKFNGVAAEQQLKEALEYLRNLED